MFGYDMKSVLLGLGTGVIISAFLGIGYNMAGDTNVIVSASEDVVPSPTITVPLPQVTTSTKVSENLPPQNTSTPKEVVTMPSPRVNVDNNQDDNKYRTSISKQGTYTDTAQPVEPQSPYNPSNAVNGNIDSHMEKGFFKLGAH